MFIQNVILMYRINRGVEPERITHLFSVPEENPEAFVYEIEFGNEVSNWVVSYNQNGLIVREVKNQEELEAIKTMTSSAGEEKVETL